MQSKTKKVYAEDLNYYRTGKSGPDAWITLAKGEIRRAGGTVQAEAFGSDASGRAAYMLTFQIGGDQFKLVWPVLESRDPKNEQAARVQAATMLYHDIKAKCVTAKVMGARAAFLPYLLLPTGQTASQSSSADLLEMLPKLLLIGGGK